jgi:hypothetical protein
MTVSLEVEQITNVVNVGVFVGGALYDRQHAGLAVGGLVAGLYAFCIDLVRRHIKFLLGKIFKSIIKILFYHMLRIIARVFGEFTPSKIFGVKSQKLKKTLAIVAIL